MRFPVRRQLEATDCGPVCIQMIAAYYKKRYSLQTLKEYCRVTRLGISVQDVLNGCKSIGLHAVSVQVSPTELQQMPLPAILYWRQSHYVVLYQIRIKKGRRIYYLADPDYGRIKLQEEFFQKEWMGAENSGIAIVMAPTGEFYDKPNESTSILKELGKFRGLIRGSLIKYKKSFLFAALLSGVGMMTNWVMPMIFQRTIDDGIGEKNLNLVWLLILGQFAFFLGNIISGSINSIILTKVSFKIGIDFLSSYLQKLIRLPLSFFDTKLNTDLIQRMNDQDRIQNFMTYSFSSILFTCLNLIVFSLILLNYNHYVFFFVAVFSVLSMIWTSAFLQRRKILDYGQFSTAAESKNNIYEMIQGMPEIKINNAQHVHITNWRKIQDKINVLSLKSVYLGYYQSIGSSFFDRFRDIAITGFCAYCVIKGEMTLGIMMTINYVVGQLAGPISQIQGFTQTIQDVKLSLERIEEIQHKPDEDNENKKYPPDFLQRGFRLDGVCFKYEGSFNPYVLHDIDLVIPQGKITAIVGASGSGKTTLLKLLLAFYYPQHGNIYLDGTKMSEINSDEWRKKCGVVMQDGYIFSGTIAYNIALADENPDMERLRVAAKIACLDNYVETLPLKYNTKIGKSGVDLSGGQKQRIFIARAIYKNPELIFFDEATSSLDANNEKEIMHNLKEFYQGRTVVVIAHRLSTVKDADNIIVLENGRIMEEGNHRKLSCQKGKYYELVKNQLELGN